MKKWNWNNKYIGWGITAFLVILSGLITYYLMFHGSKLLSDLRQILNILMPVLFGLVIAYLMTPVMNVLEIKYVIPLCNKLHLKETKKRNDVIRIICILLTLTLFTAVIYELIYMLISEIVPSVVSIASNFDEYVDNMTNWLNKILENNPTVRDNVTKMVDNYSAEINTWFNTTVLSKTSEILKTVSLGVIGSLKVIWNFIIGIIISLYVMINKEKFAGQFKKIIYAAFDMNSANIIINNVKFTHRTFSGFIGGKVLDSILIGLLCFIGTTLMQTPYAALVSVIIGVTNIIPFFGPYLGAIPSAILIFIVDPMHPLNCVYFAIFILVLQQFDGNILGPKILGDSTGLTSFWVIFAITFFGGLWGVLGMLMGVPIFAVIYAAIKSIIETKLRKKDLPTGSDEYIYVCAIDDKGLHTYTPENKQRSKEIQVYQFGQRFISDSEEQISGEYMTQKSTKQSNKTKHNNHTADQAKQNAENDKANK